MGLRRRITIGFFSLVALLLFAVAISIAELGRLREDAREIVEAGDKGSDLAAMMMSGLQKQNSAILRMVATEHLQPDSEYNEGNIRTEYEENFSSMGININMLEVVKPAGFEIAIPENLSRDRKRYVGD